VVLVFKLRPHTCWADALPLESSLAHASVVSKKREREKEERDRDGKGDEGE
jgi:hypothetical protein